MKNKLCKILKESEKMVCRIINNNIETVYIEKIIKDKDFPDIKKGIYLVCDDKDEIVYIGQGGTSRSTELKKRILQELRNFKKTDKGNNGGTLSKNIQSKDDVEFKNDSEFKEYINKWKIKILNCDELDIHIDIIESLCIELYKPIYNIKGNN